MSSGTGRQETQRGRGAARAGGQALPIHPAWHQFMRYCRDLGYGEITTLKIQDGLPVLAEVTTQKVKFS